MLKEDYLEQLMSAVYDKKTLNLFDFSAEIFSPEGEEFQQCIEWAKELVLEKLAAYSDQEKTTLQLTNFGRYWILKGGYAVYLRDNNSKKDFRKLKDLEKEKLIKEKEELMEARLKLTHFRLWGFWLSLIISLIGFTLSLFNLYLILRNKN
jgi:hypothetical protein